MNSKDKATISHLAFHKSYVPEKAFETFYKFYKMTLELDLDSNKKYSNHRRHFFNLGHALKSHFLSNGALQNDLQTIKAACEIHGRLHLIGYSLVDDLQNQGLFFHNLFYSILAKDEKAIKLYLEVFKDYKFNFFLAEGIKEVCSRKELSEEKNQELLKLYKPKQRSKWGTAVNDLIKAVLIRDEKSYIENSYKALRLHRSVGAANTWYSEISIPTKTLAFIAIGLFNKEFKIPDLNRFNKFAIPDLNEFFDIKPNNSVMEIILKKDQKLYDRVKNLKFSRNPEDLIDLKNLKSIDMTSPSPSKSTQSILYSILKVFRVNQN